MPAADQRIKVRIIPSYGTLRRYCDKQFAKDVVEICMGYSGHPRDLSAEVGETCGQISEKGCWELGRSFAAVTFR